MDYSDILNAVNQYTEADETGRFDGYIAMVTAYLNHKLRTTYQMQQATSIAEEGQTVFGVPENYLSFRHISLNGKYLDYLPPDQMTRYQQANLRDVTRYYSLIGNGLELYPACVENDQLTIHYYATVPILEDENWVSETYPDVYFYGALEQAFSYHMDDAREQKFHDKLRAAVDAISDKDKSDKWPGGSLEAKAVDYVV